MKTISIITPCYNAENYIKDTMISVLTNSAIIENQAKLQYIICDGNSKDKTLEVAKEVYKKYARENITLEIISEDDDGMYDALCKGFERVTGDVCAYINAADLYSPYAFEVALDLFTREGSQLKWLTGRAVIYNWKKQQVFNRLPYKYRSNLIQCGLYGNVFPHIQQESTFWSVDLLKSIDVKFLKSLKLAGDLYLWYMFSKQAQLCVVNTWLGGYRHHDGALSADMSSYHAEVNQFIRKPTEIDYKQAENDKLYWDASDDIKVSRNQKEIYWYCNTNKWFEIRS